MENKTLFVDVILPLAIPNLLTYRVPLDLNEYVVVGQRVIVQLGKSKLYTAIIRSIHEQAPSNYTAKYLEALLDDGPIVNEIQLKLWEWMSKYYMCHIGEVMSAALPSSLKLASETRLVLDDRWDGDLSDVGDRAEILVDALQVQENLTLEEASGILDVKNVRPVVKRLIELGVIATEEELQQRYRPKMVDFVTLHPEYHSDDSLQSVFDQLEKRAPKQLEMLMAFFHLSGSVPHMEREVKRPALQKHIGADASLTKKLVEKDIFVLESRQVDRILTEKEENLRVVDLNDEQLVAMRSIQDQWRDKDVVVLHGVTGSGKTEVYLKLIEDALAKGQQVLYLLPEIALTTQIINRLRRYLGERVGIYHSKFNQNERVEIWNDVLLHEIGKYDVILGARSAALLPFSNLGLIVVDEEHENSYKQYDPAPRYNARDLAIVLAKLHKSQVLLGSATPSVETYWQTKQGTYGLATIDKRFGGIQLPEILCADIRQDLKNKSMKGIFTTFLMEKIKAALEKNEQVILFQNRRGYAPLWQCEVCADVPQCKRCDVSLTYHKLSHQLKCHYCGYAKTPPNVCTTCGSSELKMLGQGTERIEEEITEFFPEARTVRMDLDTTRSKNAYQRIINDFEEGDIDILVGTQMVTKGLDFDNVSLVGVLNADHMINFPDFRSFERAYQLMAQVAGRAGRKKKRGEVVIQTYNPEHWVIRLVIENDYLGLYNHERVERKNFLYPPFFRLIRIALKHKDLNVVIQASNGFAQDLREKLGERVVGPETPYVSRIRNRFIRHILIKIERETNPATVKQIIREREQAFFTQAEYKGTRIVFDVDPM